MNTFRSKDRRVRTARGVTWLSLLASTMSFASVIYIGPETARESLGVDRSLEVVMPSPQAAWGQGNVDVRPANRPSPSPLESAAGLLRVSGMAMGLRTDEVVDMSRMAPVAVLLAGDVMEVRRAAGSTVRRCSLAAFRQEQRNVTLILHPMIGFLAHGPEPSGMMRWHGSDAAGRADEPAPVTCASLDRLGRPPLAGAEPRRPVLIARQG